MTKKLICLLRPALIIMALGVIACGCSKDDGPDAPDSGDNTEIKITLPASVDVVKGQPCTITQQNGTIKSSDLIYLEKDGTLIACTITEATDDHFTFNLPANFTSGTYRMHVKRGDRDRVFLGSIVINIVEHSFDLKPETTVYGVVESEEGPLAGVVVSDGVECTITDADGIYQLASKKENGYVFVSIPSGYEPDRKGVSPTITARSSAARLRRTTPLNSRKQIRQTIASSSWAICTLPTVRSTTTSRSSRPFRTTSTTMRRAYPAKSTASRSAT